MLSLLIVTVKMLTFNWLVVKTQTVISCHSIVAVATALNKRPSVFVVSAFVLLAKMLIWPTL